MAARGGAATPQRRRLQPSHRFVRVCQVRSALRFRVVTGSMVPPCSWCFLVMFTGAEMMDLGCFGHAFPGSAAGSVGCAFGAEFFQSPIACSAPTAKTAATMDRFPKWQVEFEVATGRYLV